MADSDWDLKLKSFLKKTGTDFRRFGEELKEEAGKLMTEVQDPARQQKLKEGLKEVGVWARKAAEEVATVVEDGVKKAESALDKASARVNELVTAPIADPAPTPVNPSAAAPAPPPPPGPAEKSVGPSPTRAEAPPAAREKAEKTIGPRAPHPENQDDSGSGGHEM